MPETRIPMEAIHAAEAAVRDGVRIHLGENALALAAAGQPLMLSGAEAEHAARLAVMAAAPFLAGVGSPASCPSAADIPTEAVQAAARANSEHYEVCGERDCGRCAMIYNAARRGLDAALRVMAGVGLPTSCPSAAPESTQSPETPEVAPVYPPTPEGPAETLSALRKENTCLRREVAYITRTAEMWRQLWERVDGERSRECIRADQAEAATARVKGLHSEIPYKPGFCYCANPFPCPTIRTLDGAGAVPEEHTPAVTIPGMLATARDIWRHRPRMTLPEIAVVLAKVTGDLAEHARANQEGWPADQADVAKELGNLVFSAIRWADDLGLDPHECVGAAERAQREYVAAHPLAAFMEHASSHADPATVRDDELERLRLQAGDILARLFPSIECVLIDHADELDDAQGRVDANLSELAHVYRELTGFDARTVTTEETSS